ncbi:MAG: sugar transferase [Verrucomicrobiota bacterium]
MKTSLTSLQHASDDSPEIDPSDRSGVNVVLPMGQHVSIRPGRLSLVIPWVYPLILFLFDLATWMASYSALALVLDKNQHYGAPELFLPPLGVGILLSLVGGYKYLGDTAALRYAAEHFIACFFGLSAGLVAVYLLANYGASSYSSRGIYLLTGIVFSIVSLGYRRFFWFALGRLRPKRKLLVLADKIQGRQFYRACLAHGEGLKLEFIATEPELVGQPVAGRDSPLFEAHVDDLAARLRSHSENTHEAIVVAAKDSSLDPQILGFLASVHFQDLPVYSLLTFYEMYWEKMPLHLLTATWPLQAGFHLVKHSAFAAAKRLTDILLSAFGILLAAPLMLLIAILIRIESPGPVIFRQTRVGQHRRPFTLFKFRTMRAGSEEKGIYTEKNDNRITRVGKFLRTMRFDEFPQFFNVLRGDMSLIGPRAEWIKCVEKYEAIIPHYHFRHLVRPGITGWAQVNYPYGASTEDAIEKLTYDLYYIRNFSLTLDASVTLKTIHIMLFGKGQ